MQQAHWKAVCQVAAETLSSLAAHSALQRLPCHHSICPHQELPMGAENLPVNVVTYWQ